MAESAVRVALDVRSPEWGEHRARYAYGAKYATGGANVLDLASGSGLGADILSAGNAAIVVGVDIDASAGTEARQTSPNYQLVSGSGTALPFPDQTFDLVTSFETIEHLADDGGLVREVDRVLRDDGILVLSTPNARHTKPIDGRPRNPFHVREYSKAELFRTLRTEFDNVVLLGQRPSAAYGASPYWQADEQLPRSSSERVQTVLWKIAVRISRFIGPGLYEALAGRSLYPGPSDFEFSPDVDSGHVIVALCWNGERDPENRWHRLSSKLRCTECDGESLRFVSDPRREIRFFVCETCANPSAFVNDVPEFWRSPTASAGQRRTAETFGFEFTKIANDQLDWPEVVDQFLAKTGIDADREELLAGKPGNALAGTVVLDAGCGMGRFSRVARLLGADVIAMDISSGVHRVSETCQEDPRVFPIRGSLMNPPIRPGALDGAFSIGVLHHTSDCRQAFHEVATLVKKRGWLSVWLYSPGYWNGNIRGFITRSIRLVLLALPPRFTYLFCRALMPLGKIQGILARIRLLKWLFAPLFLVTVPRDRRFGVMLSTTYDYYSPAYISTHTPDELARWFSDEGFESIRGLHVATSATGRRQ